MNIRKHLVAKAATTVSLAAALFTASAALHSQAAEGPARSGGVQMSSTTQSDNGSVRQQAQATTVDRQHSAMGARRASLLVVVAHPDDEIFLGGVLASLAERGIHVTLACATKGEAGKAHPSVGTVVDLGALRAEELRVSCERLGIDRPVFLVFHDSGRDERLRRDDPHALAMVDMLEVEAAVRGVIEDVRPAGAAHL